MENVIMPMEASIVCTIDGETFHTFTKNTWIEDLSASCNITSSDAGLSDINKINELIQESSGNMSTTKKGNLIVHKKMTMTYMSSWVTLLR